MFSAASACLRKLCPRLCAVYGPTKNHVIAVRRTRTSTLAGAKRRCRSEIHMVRVLGVATHGYMGCRKIITCRVIPSCLLNHPAHSGRTAQRAWKRAAGSREDPEVRYEDPEGSHGDPEGSHKGQGGGSAQKCTAEATTGMKTDSQGFIEVVSRRMRKGKLVRSVSLASSAQKKRIHLRGPTTSMSKRRAWRIPKPIKLPKLVQLCAHNGGTSGGASPNNGDSAELNSAPDDFFVHTERSSLCSAE